ncbi:MAG: hypothetical protein UT07_C0014G0013 [Parcubacteria group bacterium GW2011_GWB1_38_8]|uniref:Type 4 fimbrial biogenesis protein PilO n=1 Tax=Candidatus Zambryskibacteria bacterium RIFCSPLOWO2_02_FULL_39_14 TaxID=1802769 RepID=A0A1G2UHW3_9BACT|nr:MAG: hypothetical protein UT07_C0014G0013 [Parcubacteria group bacterium GW2011_GWB1_38_8]KKR29767.1 MAG: hypothetical protein UT62_C0030G0006 [Parcubacteria group bacterium GW2011_GWC1_39_8]OHA95891.1 MAG: hypothetical protein A3C62_01860 [Candidatus Zambryskibacteria bacterium RIFCSPHIGHO2_02_FULL_39_16]OHB09017.1 MAG: hypothetical protein A3I86_00725 [Candidatus Zambryskibacteria bacterium RIFCSPLOWO2_02_FULL_39_14]
MILKNSKLFIMVLVLISTTLFIVLVLGVYIVRLKNNNTSELLNTADNFTETNALVQSIRIAQRSASEDIESFNNFVLSEDKLVPLIESIEEVGRKFGLETDITSVKGTEEELVEPHIISIAVETKGSWVSVMSFLHAIESLPNRVMINESSFYKEDDDWNSIIILSLYSFD